MKKGIKITVLGVLLGLPLWTLPVDPVKVPKPATSKTTIQWLSPTGLLAVITTAYVTPIVFKASIDICAEIWKKSKKAAHDVVDGLPSIAALWGLILGSQRALHAKTYGARFGWGAIALGSAGYLGYSMRKAARTPRQPNHTVVIGNDNRIERHVHRR